MKYKKPPELKRLRKLYDYSPGTGQFIRISEPLPKIKMGQVNGSKRPDGYLNLSVDGVRYLAHRMAWYHFYGEYPGEIDHWDGNPANNAISNLRNAGRANNNLNNAGWALSKRKNKLPRGVYKYRGCLRKFRSQIVVNREIIHLGCFDTVGQAEEAYRIAAEKHFGEYAHHKRR